jgi:hypothetical protein
LCISVRRARTGLWGNMRLKGVSALTIIVCCVVVAGCAEQLAQVARDVPKAAQPAPAVAQPSPAVAQAAPAVTQPSASVAQAAPAVAQPGLRVVPEAPRDDALKDHRRMLINDVNLCVTREAQTKSLNLIDKETAAYAVVARCTGPLQEFKSYMAGHFPGNPPQFENWWLTEEADTLDFAKKAIALARTE